MKNELIENCLNDWKNPEPFISLGDFYFKNKNYYGCYLSYTYAFHLGCKKIENKLFELENDSHLFPIKKANNYSIIVSVIMPTHNRQTIIRNSIGSVLGQTVSKIELIIINDGGTNELDSIIEEFNDQRIRYLKLPKSLGVSAARNEGLKISNGKYIAYLDDDDIFYPDHLETLIDLLETSQSDLVYSNCYRVFGEHADSNFNTTSKEAAWKPNKFKISDLLINNFISTLNVLHKRECIQQVGGFNTDIRYCEDWDLWVRIACSYKISSTSKITGEYRFRKKNNEQNTSLKHENLMHFYDRLLSDFYGSLFFYHELYFHFETHNKFEECLFYQKRIIELFHRGFYPFNKQQLISIERVLKKNFPPIPNCKRITIYTKLFRLKILQNVTQTFKQLNRLYNQHLGWRLKQ